MASAAAASQLLSVGHRRVNFLQGLHHVPNGVGDLVGHLGLRNDVANEQECRLHPVQVPNAFPAHRLVDMEQQPLAFGERVSLDDGGPEILPGPLEITVFSYCCGSVRKPVGLPDAICFISCSWKQGADV